MSKKLYSLSRRKMLAGLGTIGLASAGAGLGTTAYFNDTESFENNKLQAGTLDLLLDWKGQYNESGVMGDTTPGSSADTGVFQTNGDTVDGPAQMFAYLEDVKPGDYGFVVICPRIQDNPGYLWMKASTSDDNENAPNNEPENVSESNFPADGTDYLDALDGSGGELDDVMNVWISYVDEGALGSEAAPDASTALKSYYMGKKGDIYDGNADGLDAAGAISLDGDRSTSDVIDPFAADDPSTEENETAPPCIAIEFEVPAAVGNEIQGDSFVSQFDFTAVQARHNPTGNSTSPWNSS